MNEGISTIRPGLLVGLKTELTGGAEYKRLSLENKKKGTSEVKKWETTRVVADVAEYEAAKVARGLASTAIRRVCINTSFGLICPTDREGALNAGIAAAERIEQEFNSTSKRARITIRVLRGRFTATDEEAVKAILSDVRSLKEGMEKGILNGDVKLIRDAANRARSLGMMLDGEKANKVAEGIKAAREAAREIVKRVEKGGEELGKVLGEISNAAVEKVRFAYLDFEDHADKAKPEGKALPAVEVKRFAEVK